MRAVRFSLSRGFWRCWDRIVILTFVWQQDAFVLLFMIPLACFQGLLVRGAARKTGRRPENGKKEL
jgi:hypothetical protein